MRLIIYDDRDGLLVDFVCDVGRAVSEHYPKAMMVTQHPSIHGICFVDEAGGERGGVGPLPPIVPDWIARWFCSGEVGLSSLALARFLSGAVEWTETWPCDEGDARRCAKLLWRCSSAERPIVEAKLEPLWADEHWAPWRETILGDEREETP